MRLNKEPCFPFSYSSCNSEIGLFLTLTEPTKVVSAEAVPAGCYESASEKKYPRLQFLTIESLLAGTARAEFPTTSPTRISRRRRARPQLAFP